MRSRYANRAAFVLLKRKIRCASELFVLAEVAGARPSTQGDECLSKFRPAFLNIGDFSETAYLALREIL